MYLFTQIVMYLTYRTRSPLHRYAGAYQNLGNLLGGTLAPQSERRGDLARAAALYDECVEHYVAVVGSGHTAVKAQKANAARVRAMMK